jgi:Protein of unknown function (DUF2934)
MMAIPLEFHFAQLSFFLHSFPSSSLRYKQERLPVAKEGMPMKPAPTPIRPTSQKAESASELDQIRLRAFELYEQRGGGDGHELDDWLRAEAEATQKKTK